MNREQIKRFEDRLKRYAENLKKNGRIEAAAAVEAVREAFTQELYLESFNPK